MGAGAGSFGAGLIVALRVALMHKRVATLKNVEKIILCMRISCV